MKYATLPFNQNKNGWLNEKAKSNPALSTNITADWVVIGSGFAGLAFARRIANLHPDWNIVVVDAECAGESSSARNSGFIIGLPHNIGSSTAELKKAQTYRSLLQEGIQQLASIVEQYKIACEWENVGKYHCQVDATNDRLLREYSDNLDAMGETYQTLDANQLTQTLGTRFYQKGIYTPGAILVNPASLTLGLAASLPDNVTLYDNTPVMKIEHGQPMQVITPHGIITAPKVMLATNALSRELSPVPSRQAAMATFASLTAPLSAEQRQRLPAMKSWGLTPVNAIAGASVRYTHDHRVMIRQHVIPALNGSVTATQTWQATLQHRNILQRLWPQLTDVAFTHTWSGTISVTRNGAPVWGAIGPGLYTASGCNGAGISKQTIAGSLLADYALGQDNPLIAPMLELGEASYLPPSPVLDAAIGISLLKERWLGRREA